MDNNLYGHPTNNFISKCVDNGIGFQWPIKTLLITWGGVGGGKRERGGGLAYSRKEKKEKEYKP